MAAVFAAAAGGGGVGRGWRCWVELLSGAFSAARNLEVTPICGGVWWVGCGRQKHVGTARFVAALIAAATAAQKLAVGGMPVALPHLPASVCLAAGHGLWPVLSAALLPQPAAVPGLLTGPSPAVPAAAGG